MQSAFVVLMTNTNEEENFVSTLILGDKGLSVCSTPFRAYPSREDT